MKTEINPQVEHVVDEAPREPVIPENHRQTRAGLGHKGMHLYGAILAAFPKLGGPPGSEWVQAAAAKLGLDPEAALRELVELDLVTRDAATGAI